MEADVAAQRGVQKSGPNSCPRNGLERVAARDGTEWNPGQRSQATFGAQSRGSHRFGPLQAKTITGVRAESLRAVGLCAVGLR